MASRRCLCYCGMNTEQGARHALTALWRYDPKGYARSVKYAVGGANASVTDSIHNPPRESSPFAMLHDLVDANMMLPPFCFEDHEMERHGIYVNVQDDGFIAWTEEVMGKISAMLRADYKTGRSKPLAPAQPWSKMKPAMWACAKRDMYEYED